jgi:hypothetical protein
MNSSLNIEVEDGNQWYGHHDPQTIHTSRLLAVGPSESQGVCCEGTLSGIFESESFTTCFEITPQTIHVKEVGGGGHIYRFGRG